MAPRPTDGQAAQGEADAGSKLKMLSQPKFDSPEEEREYRKERLALGYRVFGRLGFEEGVAGHLTYRDPIITDAFWTAGFGIPFSLTQTSDLLLIGHDGKVIMGGKPGKQLYNQAAFAIHHAIHTARPEIDAAAHSHSIYGKTFSTLNKPIEITTQDSCVFYKKCGLYSTFGGVAVDDEEGQNIAKALGDGTACILANHGILTAGKTIEAATHRFIALERHCQVMLLADAACAREGNKPTLIDEEDAIFTQKQTGTEEACWFQALAQFALSEYDAKKGLPYVG